MAKTCFLRGKPAVEARKFLKGREVVTSKKTPSLQPIVLNAFLNFSQVKIFKRNPLVWDATASSQMLTWKTAELWSRTLCHTEKPYL